MSRPLKPYGKKRGHRRTGSRRTAYWVEAALFGAVFLAGCAMLIVMLRTMIWPEWHLNQEFVETWLFALVPVAMIVVGGSRLVFALRHAGKSRERSAAAAGQNDHFERRDADGHESGGHDEPFPHVPSDENITNSPGTTLAYRLPISTSPGWKLFGTLLLCLFWNGVVSVFVVMVVRGHLSGRPNWWLTAFVAPLVIIALGTIYYFLRQLLVTRGVGPTRLEIGEHPIYPGQTYEVLISQTGRLSVGSLEVLLACDEEATYQQGTDTRTDRQRVFDQRVFHREDFDILPGEPFEDRCRFEVPDGSMHSFKSDNNEI